MFLADREIGSSCPPLVIAEIGINHEGSFKKALQMIEDASDSGCECVKFQCHVIEDEMIPNNVIPGNAEESIWHIMERCALTMEEEVALKHEVEKRGMIYLSTPFSRAAADRLESMGVQAYKIGSGECNNYPLVKHISEFGKPIVISTGMNDYESISVSVDILRKSKVPFAILECTSMYPTPYEKVRLGCLAEIRSWFADAVIGLSDHSLGNYTSFAAVALGASIIEKHFTHDKTLPGNDHYHAMDKDDLQLFRDNLDRVFDILGVFKVEVLEDEDLARKNARRSLVAQKDIPKGKIIEESDLTFKRPAHGISPKFIDEVVGKTAVNDISDDVVMQWNMLV